MSFRAIGIFLIKQGNYTLAIEYLQKSLMIYEQFHNKKMTADLLGNISGVYDYLYDYPMVAEYTNKALVINKEINNKKGRIANIGTLAKLYSDKGKYENSLETSQNLLPLIEEFGNKFDLAMFYNNIGVT